MSYLLRSRRGVVKNLSIMVLDRHGRLMPVRALPTVVPHRHGLRVLLVLLGPRAPRRGRLVLVAPVARAALGVRVVFHVPVAHLAPVDQAAVLVVRPVRVALVARLVVLEVHPVRA